MPINPEKMKQERARRQGAGDLWNAPPGDSNVYMCAPMRPEMETPFVECRTHYGLGAKGQSGVICLEPSVNQVLNDPFFIAQLAELGKDVSGGCPVCEALDRGDRVSIKDDQDGKANSRWMTVIVPMSHRGDARGNFQAFPALEVKGWNVGWKVWDQISDMFGSAGDITDPNGATLIRVGRVGEKINTQWTVGPDIESLKKPMKLDKQLLAAVAEASKPSAKCDPYRLLASMVHTRAESENILNAMNKGGDKGGGEYEETNADETASKPADKKFTPPTKGNQTSKPAATGAAKPAAKTETKPAQASKPATKPASKGDSEDAKLKVLISANGAPPSCFKIDPDSGEEICQKCAFKVPCATFCGVEVPPDVAESESAEDVPDETPSEMISVDQCAVGSNYIVGGVEATYKGPAKGKHLFVTSDNKALKVDNGTMVEAPGAPAEVEAEAQEEQQADNDDDKLKKLEAELAARKKANAAKTK